MNLNTKFPNLGFIPPIIGFSQHRLNIRRQELEDVRTAVLVELEARLQTVQKENRKYINDRVETMVTGLRKTLETTILNKIEEVMTKLIEEKNSQTEHSHRMAYSDLEKKLSESLRNDIDSKLGNIEDKFRYVIREEFKDLMIKEDGWEKLN